MSKKLKLKSGFTLIEVTLVLAISALIVSGLMVGTTATIARQRYNDAINDLAGFFRQAYSEVINVQNVRSADSNSPIYCSVSTAFNSNGDAVDPLVESTPGRSDCAIYGKLLTIGELADSTSLTQDLHSYDVIGEIFSPDDYKNISSTNSDLNTLKKIGANVLTFSTVNNSECALTPAGNASSYSPLWGMRLETTSADSTPFRGAILIFRSPLSGTIQTYYIDYSSRAASDQNLPINITYSVDQFQSLGGSCNKNTISPAKSQRSKYLAAILDDSALATNDNSNNEYITFCAASDDLFQTGNRRRAIRIAKGGHNATAVELLNVDTTLQDGGENLCQ